MITKKEFYSELNDSLTGGCMLPFTVPDKALDIIVKNTHRWFTRNWDDATQNIYLSLPKEVWSQNEEFKATRTLTLPKCIYSVNVVAKDSKSKRNMGGQADFSFEKYAYSNWGVNGGFSGSEDGMQSDAVLGYVVAASWSDLTYHILNYPISYDYSRLNNKLFLKGSLDSNPDFLLDCDIRLPKEALYELDLFFNYVEGKARQQLSNIVNTFKIPLPGNAEIDYESIRSDGKEMVEKVEEEVKSMRGGSDFFLTTNGM